MAAAELNCSSSGSNLLVAVLTLVLRSRLGYALLAEPATRDLRGGLLLADGLPTMARGLGTLDEPSGLGTSLPFSSTNLPPPPGPPGIYLRFFGGGSVSATATRLDRAVEVDVRGRPRRRAGVGRCGVDGAEGISRGSGTRWHQAAGRISRYDVG